MARSWTGLGHVKWAELEAVQISDWSLKLFHSFTGSGDKLSPHPQAEKPVGVCVCVCGVTLAEQAKVSSVACGAAVTELRCQRLEVFLTRLYLFYIPYTHTHREELLPPNLYSCMVPVPAQKSAELTVLLGGASSTTQCWLAKHTE